MGAQKNRLIDSRWASSFEHPKLIYKLKDMEICHNITHTFFSNLDQWDVQNLANTMYANNSSDSTVPLKYDFTSIQ